MITVKATVSGANNIKKLQNVDTSATTFVDLAQRLAQKCNLSHENISMSYRDEDGDQVDLDDEETLQDAFHTTLTSQASVKTLAILVQVKERSLEIPLVQTTLSIESSTPLVNRVQENYGATIDDSFDDKRFGTPSKQKPRTKQKLTTHRTRGMLVVILLCMLALFCWNQLGARSWNSLSNTSLAKWSRADILPAALPSRSRPL